MRAVSMRWTIAVLASAGGALTPSVALADGPSHFLLPRVTSHLLTNARIIERFVDARIAIDGEPGREGTVAITPDPRFAPASPSIGLR